MERIAASVTAIAVVFAGTAAVQFQQLESPVHRIDHIMIRTGHPRELFSFLSDDLQLPIAWPLASRSGVTSGGVSLGNVVVEAINFPGQASATTHLVGFGFEPAPLDSALAELRRRGIRFGEPRPFETTREDGTRQRLFTNVTLSDLSDADRPPNATVHIFLSEYSPAYVNVEERRLRLRRELVGRNGGSLGVMAVTEVIVGTTDLSRATQAWQRLLGPPRSPHVWDVGDGPAIRLVSATDNSLQGLVVRVASLQRARGFLRERNMVQGDTRRVTIDSPMLTGVRIELVESR
jgi:hypothetical protein